MLSCCQSLIYIMPYWKIILRHSVYACHHDFITACNDWIWFMNDNLQVSFSFVQHVFAKHKLCHVASIKYVDISPASPLEMLIYVANLKADGYSKASLKRYFFPLTTLASLIGRVTGPVAFALQKGNRDLCFANISIHAEDDLVNLWKNLKLDQMFVCWKDCHWQEYNWFVVLNIISCYLFWRVGVLTV